PVIACQEIHHAVAVNIRRRGALRILEFSALIAALAGSAGVNRREWPRLSGARIGGNVGDKKRLCALVPEDELRFAGVLEVAEDLVVMLRFAALFYQVPFPGYFRIKTRIRILPPPDLVALPITPENNVEVTVTVDVASSPAGFNCEKLRLDDITGPAVPRAA